MDSSFVFLIDVDNTLLDNDKIKEEIRKSLISVLGEEEANHFWAHHDYFRVHKKLVDFPNIIKEYCLERDPKTCDITLGRIFQSIDFKRAVYPKVPEVISHLRTRGRVIIFSEGDSVYQKMKIEKSGLTSLADEVILFEHKLDHLEEIKQKYQGKTLVFLDDKADILEKIKKEVPDSKTVLVCQGHYAAADHPPHHEEADKTVDSLNELLSLDTSEVS